jgi:hypothetical protein
MKSTTLKWKQPAAVKQWIKSSYPPEPTASKILLIVLLILLFSTAIYLLVKGKYFLLPILFGPVIMGRLRELTPRYSIGEKGLSIQNGLSGKSYQWRDVEWYALEAITGLDGVSWLRIKTRKKGQMDWPVFYFDEQQINREELLEILSRFAPSKHLKEMPEDFSNKLTPAPLAR